MKLIVTGTGRCGTGYVAAVLNEAGMACGHEWRFGPHGDEGGADMDSSWMAAPYLEQHPEARRVLLWRDPTEVIESFLGIRFFERDTDWLRFQQTHTTGGWGMPFQQACNHYAEWNRMALRSADAVVSLSDIDWRALLGVKRVPKAVRDAVRVVPPHVNSRSHTPLPGRLPQYVSSVHAELIAATTYGRHDSPRQ